MQETLRQLTGYVVARVWPDGGQGQSRRNAWSAMVADNARARARADADAAVQAALALPEAASMPEQPVVATRG